MVALIKAKEVGPDPFIGFVRSLHLVQEFPERLVNINEGAIHIDPPRRFWVTPMVRQSIIQWNVVIELIQDASYAAVFERWLDFE